MLQWYPADHKLILYEATTLPIMPPRIEEITIGDLDSATVKTITTLYVPPLSNPEPDLNFCNLWNVDINQLK